MTSISFPLRPLLVVGSLAALLVAVPRASAQPTDTFLEQRVVESLAADGVVLSRLGVTLDVEQIGGKTLVSLIEPATGRATASTKVDTLPADADAAVASIALVVRNLVDQVIDTEPAREAPPAVAAEPPPPLDDTAERQAREMAQLRYDREAIRFGADLVVSGTNGVVSSSRRWVAMRGETDHRLAPREFYELLGRPDLASRYQSRRNTGTALMVAGGGAVVLGLGYSIYVAATQDDCELGPDFGTCFDENGKRFTRAVTIALVGGAVGIGVAGIGYYYRARAHPVSENEAKQLADQYNEGLRHDLGLPTLTSTLRPRIRDVQWAPVVDPSTGSGGLSLTGRF